VPVLRDSHALKGIGLAARREEELACLSQNVREVLSFSLIFAFQIFDHCVVAIAAREFNRTHGRPVMKQEDIQPVAQEYQRYKVGSSSFTAAALNCLHRSLLIMMVLGIEEAAEGFEGSVTLAAARSCMCSA